MKAEILPKIRELFPPLFDSVCRMLCQKIHVHTCICLPICFDKLIHNANDMAFRWKDFCIESMTFKLLPLITFLRSLNELFKSHKAKKLISCHFKDVI